MSGVRYAVGDLTAAGTTQGTVLALSSAVNRTADGDLKVRFSDGTIKTIVVDT